MDQWICFLAFLKVALCLTNKPYELRSQEASFDEAMESCQHDGFLTDMAEEEEAEKIISLIELSANHAGTLQYWVGLRKSKKDCTLKDELLKGFKWTVNNSTDTKLSKWRTNPPETCTNQLCGLLTVEHNGKKVTEWGWTGSGCKEKHPFICKTNIQAEPSRSECESPHIFNAQRLIQVMDDPRILEVHCTSNEKFNLTCSPSTGEWKTEGRFGDISDFCHACLQGYTKNNVGICIDIDECENNPCEYEHGCNNTQGSYKCTCNTARGYVLNEDSKSCKKLPISTTAPPDSTTIQFISFTNPSPKTTNGEITEPNLPLGTSTTTGASVILESSDDQSSIWIPVLAAVLSLIFLVVIIFIVVKCCLRKRSKKLPSEKGGKSKESVVLKTADSMEEVNQKETV